MMESVDHDPKRDSDSECHAYRTMCYYYPIVPYTDITVQILASDPSEV